MSKRRSGFYRKTGIDYELVDFKTRPVDCDIVKPWLEQVGIKTLLNTRGTTYRTLKLKALDLSEEEQMRWLCKENLLIKRPVLDRDGKITVGFDPEHYKKLFA